MFIWRAVKKMDTLFFTFDSLSTIRTTLLQFLTQSFHWKIPRGSAAGTVWPTLRAQATK